MGVEAALRPHGHHVAYFHGGTVKVDKAVIAPSLAPSSSIFASPNSTSDSTASSTGFGSGSVAFIPGLHLPLPPPAAWWHGTSPKGGSGAAHASGSGVPPRGPAFAARIWYPHRALALSSAGGRREAGVRGWRSSAAAGEAVT